jgi:glycosyltransferase involved in cell wall biosynthesis
MPSIQHKIPKILHTMTWLAPGGGADLNVFLTIRDLNPEYEFHLAVGHEIHENPFLDIPGLKIHICPWLDRPIRPLKDLVAFFWFWRLIQREKFDVVHTHESKAGIISRVAARFAGCPRVIFGLHGVPFNDPTSKLGRLIFLAAEGLTMWAADQVVSVSREALGHYHAQNLGRDLPYHVVYSGVELDRFVNVDSGRLRAEARDEFGIPADATVLLNVGRFSIAKAQRHTIEAFARLRGVHPDLKLVLVGVGPELKNCKSLCRSLNVENDVVFAGYQADIVKMYALADVNVLTSLVEGLPRVVVEASLCKLPTVCFDVPGVKEVIQDGVSGDVVASEDLDELTERITQLVVSPDARRVKGRKAFERASVAWDHRRMVEDLRGVYEYGGEIVR